MGTIFVNEDILEEKSVRIYEIDLYFSEHYKKKYKLIVMVKNTYCLELIFILLNIASEIDEKGHTDRDLIFEEKRQKTLEKNLIVNLLELILVEKILMKTVKQVEYKYL